MKTEEIKRTPRSGSRNEVSRALQELAPLACTIVDRRGRPVPLSAAGYVLRFGRSYRLRVRPPFPDADIDSVRIISAPTFLTVEPETREVDEHGESVRSIPFTVSVGWLAQMARLNMLVLSDDLQVSYHFRPGVIRQPPIFECPIVARPVWTLALMAVLATLLSVIPRIATDLFLAEQPTETLRRFVEPLLTWEPWLWLAGISTVLWLLVTLVHATFIYRRSRDLEHAFHEQFPSF